MKTYTDYCKDFIIDNIEEFIGGNYYVNELGNMLTMGINADCSATYNRNEAIEYLKNWWQEVGDFMEYYKNYIGNLEVSPFLEAEKFHVIMIIHGIDNLLSQCDVIQELWENDETELTQEICDSVIKNLKEIEIEW